MRRTSRPTRRRVALSYSTIAPVRPEEGTGSQVARGRRSKTNRPVDEQAVKFRFCYCSAGSIMLNRGQPNHNLRVRGSIPPSIADQDDQTARGWLMTASPDLV